MWMSSTKSNNKKFKKKSRKLIETGNGNWRIFYGLKAKERESWPTSPVRMMKYLTKI